ncbi:MAG TPA: hypothetical protein VJT13_25610 [Xanthobacteraceae bacterium]|nr:hypothetical protein [Xanthobacteraceae bacterium]
MARILIVVLLAAFVTAAQAQGFYTLKTGSEAWWLRASFNPMHTEVRGIPVTSIRATWCKATEYTAELMKDLLAQEQAGQTMKEARLAFAVEGQFDRSRVKQVALVGVYQECAGRKGAFLLIIDAGTNKVRFVDTTPGEAQFAAVGAAKRDIVFTTCLECDGGGVLRWNAKKKTFAWVPQRGRD